MIACAVVLLVSCSKEDNDGGGGDGGNDISVPNQSELNQTVYADKTEGTSGVSFTTTGAWTSTLTSDVKSSDNVDWVSYAPQSGDKAGNYEINITLLPNMTDADRKAQIKITCKNTVITINIEQKRNMEDGTVIKLVDMIKEIDPDGFDIGSKMSYDNQGKLISYISYEDGQEIESGTLTYSDNQITVESKEIEFDGVQVINKVYNLENGVVVSSREDDNTYESDQWSYNADGYLIKHVENYEYSLDNTQIESDVTDYTWDNNNIVNALILYYGDDNPVSYVYEYNQMSNDKCNIDFVALLMDRGIISMLGYDGKKSANLISKEIVSGDQWNKDNGVTTYRYVTDEDGCVTEIYEQYQSEGGAGGAERLAYEITYK